MSLKCLDPRGSSQEPPQSTRLCTPSSQFPFGRSDRSAQSQTSAHSPRLGEGPCRSPAAAPRSSDSPQAARQSICRGSFSRIGTGSKASCMAASRESPGQPHSRGLGRAVNRTALREGPSGTCPETPTTGLSATEPSSTPDFLPAKPAPSAAEARPFRPSS